MFALLLPMRFPRCAPKSVPLPCLHRPAHLMDDGRHTELNNGRNLFEDFSEVAESTGVYTAID